MIRRWVSGVLAGTVLIAVTSPLFVRSYVPRVLDPTREALVLLPGSSVRWRREGYATTSIGPLGMPGKTASELADPSPQTFALWGDSQAEGLCVDDSAKPGRQIEQQSGGRVAVLPFGRSGDDCNDWIRQIAVLQSRGNRIAALPSIEPGGRTVTGHLFLVTELSDWMLPIDSASETASPLINAAAEWSPAFLIHAARNALTDEATLQPRRLRFGLGPVANNAPPSNDRPDEAERLYYLDRQLRRLSEKTRLPCVFAYAPPWPAIIDGRVVDSPDEAKDFDAFSQRCAAYGFAVLDIRNVFRESVKQNQWPIGFDNGQIGQGHLNDWGYTLIAREVAAFLDRPQPRD